MHIHQVSSQHHRQDEDFLEWLSPSYWQVEAQLVVLRNQTNKHTLKWVKNLEAFSAWRTCPMELTDRHHVLWIKGHPGVGKSTISAYLVDFIKCLYPSSIVAYFFCKSGQMNLTNAVDIIRTFAHHLSMGSTKIRSALQTLKDSRFQIDENVGIHLLFEKLVAQPLALSEEEIYFILDGVDEADLSNGDKVGNERQMDIMIRALIALPNIKIIFTSRPDVKALEIVTVAATYSITAKDSKDDIRTYVTQVIQQSQRLQRQFERQGIHPVEYFQKHSNGIFLWVTSALQILSTAKSKSAFEDCLRDFTGTSGLMDGLYSIILDRMDRDNINWVREILLWHIGVEEEMREEELRAAVETSLGDEHDDFTLLLESGCGSILQTLDDARGNRRIQLVHETFRSFITDPNRCSPDWVITGSTTHARLAKGCINILCSDRVQPERLMMYAGSSWLQHLLQTDTTVQISRAAIVDVYRLFTSSGIRAWVVFGLRDLPFLLRFLSAEDEEPLLQSICNWYSAMKSVISYY